MDFHFLEGFEKNISMLDSSCMSQEAHRKKNIDNTIALNTRCHIFSVCFSHIFSLPLQNKRRLYSGLSTKGLCSYVRQGSDNREDYKDFFVWFDQTQKS